MVYYILSIYSFRADLVFYIMCEVCYNNNRYI